MGERSIDLKRALGDKGFTTNEDYIVQKIIDVILIVKLIKVLGIK